MSVALYTLDVGHGLCQIIMFPGRRAILIDGGDFFAQPIVSEFFERFVDILLAYVSTHNDRDHIGAALGILDMPKFRSSETLQKIWCLIDRGSNCEIPLLDYALQRERNRTIGQFGYGTLIDEHPLTPRLIHEEPEENCRLEFLYPRMSQNIPSLRKKNKSGIWQNRTSACIRLSVGCHCALITGDIDLVGLTIIIEEYGFDIAADLLTVPHHGGKIPGIKTAKSWDDILEKVSPSIAIISCGYRTKNSRTKVQSNTITPLLKSGTKICCTQITEACHHDFNRFRPGVNLALSGIVPQMSDSGQFPEAIGCCGSIQTVFTQDSFYVQHLPEHPQVVQKKVSIDDSPLCLFSPI